MAPISVAFRIVATSPHGPAPITGLSHVQLLVSDVSASAAWYSLVLGLDSYAEDIDIGYVALRHRDARLVVVLTADPDLPAQDDDGGGPNRPDARRGRLDHLAFAVPDGNTLRTWADHLIDAGIDHAGVVTENGNPSLQLRDPDGVAIELVAPGTTSTEAPLRPTPMSPG